MTDKTYGDIVKELADAKVIIKNFEEKERLNLIKSIKRFGNKYSDDELKEKDLKELEIIADAFSKFEPTLQEPDVIPLGNTPKEKPKENYDTAHIFDDVSKDFNLGRLGK